MQIEILRTPRLILREITADDAAFALDLLNQPSFIKNIGDRGVRDLEQAARFIEERFRKSYSDHGYGLYVVDLKADVDGIPHRTPIGICGFVRRAELPGPDIGFAFLPQYERKGYGSESAKAMLQYGREQFGFERVLAITSLDNDASGNLLLKLGFKYDGLTHSSSDEKLKLFYYTYA